MIKTICYEEIYLSDNGVWDGTPEGLKVIDDRKTVYNYVDYAVKLVGGGSLMYKYTETYDGEGTVTDHKDYSYTHLEDTGINGLTKAQVRNAETYNLGGMRTTNLQKGLNIIRLSDGTVKKVMQK